MTRAERYVVLVLNIKDIGRAANFDMTHIIADLRQLAEGEPHIQCGPNGCTPFCQRRACIAAVEGRGDE